MGVCPVSMRPPQLVAAYKGEQDPSRWLSLGHGDQYPVFGKVCKSSHHIQHGVRRVLAATEGIDLLPQD